MLAYVRCGFHLLCSHAGDLLTVTRRLYMRPRVRPELPTRAFLHQKPPADRSRHFSSESHLKFATSANSAQSHHTRHNSQRFSTSPRSLLSFSGHAGHSEVQFTVPKRHLTPGNQLVGGVFLHLTRKTPVVSCSPHFSRKLYHACYYEQVTGNAIPGVCTCICCESIVLRYHYTLYKQTLIRLSYF
jgi:hypothetical protein